MNCFLDFEFTGLHQNTTPISICLVDESNNYFYAEFTDYDKSQIGDWLQKNVIDNLMLDQTKDGYYQEFGEWSNRVHCKGNTGFIRDKVTDWLSQYDKVEIWSDTLAYDWMLFNRLYGHAFLIPDNVYYIPFDIATLMKMKGVDPDINREYFVGSVGNKHNALHDTTIIKMCYEKLIKM